MADIDFASLLQNPLFMAGVQGLLAPPNQRGAAMLKGAMSAQQMKTQSQQQSLNDAKLQQLQAQANFNPADYMQTTPVQGTSLASAQAAPQPQAMPAALGGPTQGGITPMAQPPAGMAAPLTPQAGTPTGRVDMQGMLGGGMQAGYSPTEVQNMANIMDPQTALQQQMQGKLETVAPGSTVMNGLGQTVATNTNAPQTGPTAELQQLIAARDQLPPDSPARQTFQDAIDAKSGAAIKDYRAGLAADRQQKLTGDPQQVESLAQGIVARQLPPMTGYSARSPQGMAVMQRVMALDPNYNAQDYKVAEGTRTSFAKGVEGRTVRSFNVAVDHLSTLGDLADALNNGDLPAINKVSNIVAAQTGSTAPTNFDAAKRIVGQEVTKAIVGAQSGEREREAAAEAVQNANTPAQLKGVIQTYQKLMVGQLGGLKKQYEAGTKRDDFETMLTPTTKAMLGGGDRPSIVKTGTLNGRKVVQYSDGTTAFAD